VERDDYLRLTFLSNDDDGMDQVLLSSPRKKTCKDFQDEPNDRILRVVELDPCLL
jgi:hypothetical protein